jgi:hypothetical protein
MRSRNLGAHFQFFPLQQFRRIPPSLCMQTISSQIFDKTNMYAGNFTAPTIFLHNNWSVYPAANYDDGSTNVLLMGALHGNSSSAGRIQLGWINGTPSSVNFNAAPTNRLSVTQRTWITSPYDDVDPPILNSAPQQGVTNLVNIVDGRIHSLIQKDGYLYGLHSIFIPYDNPTRTILQCFRIGNGETNRWEIDDGSSHYGYPNIAVNDFGDVFVSYAKFRTNIYPSAAFQVKYYHEKDFVKDRFTAEQVFASGIDYYVFHDKFGRNR